MTKKESIVQLHKRLCADGQVMPQCSECIHLDNALEDKELEVSEK